MGKFYKEKHFAQNDNTTGTFIYQGLVFLLFLFFETLVHRERRWVLQIVLFKLNFEYFT